MILLEHIFIRIVISKQMIERKTCTKMPRNLYWVYSVKASESSPTTWVSLGIISTHNSERQPSHPSLIQIFDHQYYTVNKSDTT